MTMNAMPGSMIRLNVPQWFKEPEFQEWFNRQLGRGLATWQPANQRLQAYSISRAECEDMARRLKTHVVDAEVFFTPLDTGDAEMLESEQSRVDGAMNCVQQVYEHLKTGSEENGLSGEILVELAERLFSEVIGADVFYEPELDQQHDCYREEVRMINMATSTLDQIAMRLQSVGEMAASEDAYAYSDCFVGVDPAFNGEGTDSDMPEKYWDVIVEEARKVARGHNGLHVMVWLSPVE